MKLILTLPEALLKKADKEIAEGYYVSRSEFARRAIANELQRCKA